MASPSDSELVVATLRGSQEAYGTLVVRYERPIVGLVLRMVRNRAIAEELAQEVFVKAYNRLETYDQGRKFSSWLFKIAHNSTIDHLRRRRIDTVPLETPDEESQLLATMADETGVGPEGDTLRHELAQALELAVAELRPEYREVVVLRFDQGCSYDEIAEITGLPLGTVKTHLHRSRKQLAELLEASGWAPGSDRKKDGDK
jgi:RNA polymerase sigma-70 factor (ECF subfamily)